MAPKKVCICIPCFNNEATISNTLDSIVNQNYKNIIVKVFDNASTDRTVEIVKSYVELGYSIELFQRESNVSGEENFNTCIKESEGDFAAIFHADDVYNENIILKQVEFFSGNNQCVAVSTHARVIDDKNNILGERFIPSEIRNKKSTAFTEEGLIELVFKYGNFITCPSVLFKTDFLKENIVRFHGNKFKSSSDLNVWIRCTQNGFFGFINEPLMDYRESSASFSFNLSKVRVDDHDLFLVLNDYLESYHPESDFLHEKLKKYKEFLLLKDRSNTNFNKFILKKNMYNKVFLLRNFSLIFQSKFHFKYFLYSFFINLIIKLPQPFSKVLKKLKEKNG